MADILDKLIDNLRHHMPELPHERLQFAEAMVRAELGGCEGGYIAKRPAFQRQVALGAALQTGGTLGQAFAAAGVSERHGFRLLARPLRRPR